MKLLYAIGSIGQKGGTEKVFANKANYFADVLGYDIHLLVNEDDCDAAYNYSAKINIHNMNVSQYMDRKIIPFISYNRLIKKLYNPYSTKIKEINPDVIIVLQHSVDDFIIPILKLGIPTVREFHFSKKAVFQLIAEKPTSFSKLRAYLQKKRLFKYIEKYDYVALLTEADQKFSQYPNETVVIPNVLELIAVEPRDFSNHYKRVISVGSMHDDRKGFDKQIIIWKNIHKKYPDWNLDIYGDGIIRTDLQKLIDHNDLNGIVSLRGITNDVYKEFWKSSFFIFTSKAEGFGMVLIEAMSCGLPCISYNCPDGPADIIDDDNNGFLVTMDNEKEMINKISYLIDNEKEIERLGKSAQQSVEAYLPNIIMPMWLEFFKKIIK